MRRCSVFPGQGTQFTGMGKEFFELYPEEVARADEALGYSIVSLCIENSGDELGNTSYAQPAILFVSYLSWLEMQKRDPHTPDYLLGHSLGEYTALLISGVIDLTQALQLVQQRGRVMARAAQGGMAAVMNITSTALEHLLQQLDAPLEVANYNTPLQTVVAGTAEAISQLQSLLVDTEGYCIPLQVSGAFHCSIMREAAESFRDILDKVDFKEFNIPVISNVTGRPYRKEQIVELLTKQIYSSVQWVSSICWIEQQGEIIYNEYGPKSILLPMIDTIKNSLPKEIKCINTIHRKIRNKRFGSPSFLEAFNLVEPLMAGAMYRGISSPDLVIAMAKAGYLASLGTGGLDLESIKRAVRRMQDVLVSKERFAVNLLAEYSGSGREMKTVKMLLGEGVTIIEAAAFVEVTPALALFKIKGLKEVDGVIQSSHHIIAKVSHHMVAQKFLSPFSEEILEQLLSEQLITADEAALASTVVIADALTVEADSGGHTDQKAALTLFPALKRLRDERAPKVHIGLAGGIGTPEAALSAFMLGADYIVTGSINQATVEAGQSNAVKELLSEVTVNDTAYAPAGDMFEVGAQVQVVKKQTMFPMRARKLFELYRQYQSLDDIPGDVIRNMEEQFFKRSLHEVLKECLSQYPEEYVAKVSKDPQKKMALLFKHYYSYASVQAMSGGSDRTNYQVHCGTAMGAFNKWVKGSEYEKWQQRKVVAISEKLLNETYELYTKVQTSLLN